MVDPGSKLAQRRGDLDGVFESLQAVPGKYHKAVVSDSAK
jgi:hypothetical protein